MCTEDTSPLTAPLGSRGNYFVKSGATPPAAERKRQVFITIMIAIIIISGAEKRKSGIDGGGAFI
jgi:hypothetical protein